MITVIDDFLERSVLTTVIETVKKMEFSKPLPESPEYAGDSWTENYPGIRTGTLDVINPILNGYLIREIEKYGLPFTSKYFNYTLHANLRLEVDNKDDYIHQDGSDWAFLVYLSNTNLDSGTRFYLSGNEDGKHADVSFIKNRLVIFNSNIFHSSYNSHGSSLEDGRLTLNG